MHLANQCSPIWTIRPKDNFNVTIIRKVAMAEIFIVFLIYAVIDALLLKGINKLKLQDKKENDQKIQKLTRQYQDWKQSFMQMFGDHTISTGFIMCFAPYAFQTGLCCCFLLLFIFTLIKRFKYESDSQLAYKLMRITNLALIVCGMIGISRCYNYNGVCADEMYRQ